MTVGKIRRSLRPFYLFCRGAVGQFIEDSGTYQTDMETFRYILQRRSGTIYRGQWDRSDGYGDL